MGKVGFSLSVSLDGFIAGPNDGPDNGLGDGGERLHEWVYDLKTWREPHGLEGGETGPDADVMEEMFATTGAIVIGKRMFSFAEGPWGDDPPFHMPVFVVTHEEREPLPKQGGTTFHFVNDGIESALEQAKAAADGKDVSIGGGASVVQQALAAGLVDEFQLHIVPIMLGGGVRLFEDSDPGLELERTRTLESPTGVTHVKYAVRSR